MATNVPRSHSQEMWDDLFDTDTINVEDQDALVEPVYQDSVLFEDSEIGNTVQLAPAFEDLPDEAPAAVVPEATGAPVVVPPPKRPSTPPPTISAQERKAFRERVRQRKATLSALGKEADVQQKMDLLVEDEEDRHNCCGDWKWESFTEDKPYINEEGQFAREGEDPRGISGAARGAVTELDLLRLFLTEAVLTNLVNQTNLYATQERAKEGGSKEPWSPVTTEEIMAFIGVAIAMGIVHKGELREYWSTTPLLETPWFPSVMSGHRFCMIQRYLHLANNRTASTADGKLCDKLYKVRPLLDSLLTSFPQHYHPGKNLSLDEQMLGTKARCSFIQYMKDKPTKRGVKLWVLCDSQVHYCLNFQIYTGGTGEKGLSFRVVNELMSPYLGKFHHLYTDNFYTSPELLAHLLTHDTLAVGTVRQDRLSMPMRLRTSVEVFEPGQSVFYSSHKMTVCRWKDKRDVFCLSTVHGNTLDTIARRKRGTRGEMEDVQKPKMVLDYNTHMGGVDVYDQLLSYNPVQRRYKRWWIKIFFRLIDMTIVNSFALWKLKQVNLPRNSHKKFRIALAEQLVAPYRERYARPLQSRQIPNRMKHVSDPTSYTPRKKCAVCQDDNRKTTSGCRNCGDTIRLHFCNDDGQMSCFVKYHTKHDYTG
ncbi:piggyBac transposable element-derived protein 4-like [Apostichopus japonicus]|uniref:piggyBac transposable element-derived protein 4-like n=1 Tax=Stichopus japonicus TaxID=307972 RepID=UPI003AB24189